MPADRAASKASELPACSERSLSSSAPLSSPPSPVSPSLRSSSSTFSHHHQSFGGVYTPVTQVTVKIENEAVWRPW
ncbi:hypothetical protein MRX96_002149 [Rhipicephalus microplus]